MQRVSLLDMMRQEEEIQLDMVMQLKQKGTLEVSVDNLFDVITGCINCNIAVKITPINSELIRLSI